LMQSSDYNVGLPRRVHIETILIIGAASFSCTYHI
jgi:hypothetical protein